MKEYAKLPWYVEGFYDKEKNCYILKVNKWWAAWSLFKHYLFLRWLRRNTYPYNWEVLTGDIEVSGGDHGWVVPDGKTKLSE